MSQKILNDKEQKMETKHGILEEINTFIDEAETAIDDFYTSAISLAGYVARNSAAKHKQGGEIAEFIHAFIEADKRYTKAMDEATEACEILYRFLKGGRKRGSTVSTTTTTP